MTLAAFLKQKREEQGMLASQLADKAGLTRSHISEIERGKIALPNADIRRRLAVALGVSHLDLLIAAGEITRAELGTVAGIVEQDPTDPRLELTGYLKRIRLSHDREVAIRGMLRALLEDDQEGRG